MNSSPVLRVHPHLSSCSSTTAGPPTASSSLDSPSTGECEMAPHSPQRAGAPPPAAPAPPPVALPPYAPPPPPPYAPPPTAQAWPVPPPNVYVSQVTANVNLHGYMGQYYQPPQAQYAPPPTERPPRINRRERRFKRPPSPPPPQPPPYVSYVTYPPYYPGQPPQSAPLYSVPFYQPLAYLSPYQYAPYAECTGAEDSGEKGPEDYPPEMMMEHEAVDVYYPPHFVQPAYEPARYGPEPTACSLEYAPVFVPPPPHQPSHHQFNVHAKNFVRQSDHAKPSYNAPQESKVHDQLKQINPASTTGNSVESLPIKDLKISSGRRSPSPKRCGDAGGTPTSPKTVSNSNDKASKVAGEGPKSTWAPNGTKTIDNLNNQKTLTSSQANSSVGVGKSTAPVIKMTKGPAPFVNNKQIVKGSTPPQPGVVQQQSIPSKAPFTSKQRRDLSTTKSLDIGAVIEVALDKSNETAKQLASSGKSVVPISINLHPQQSQIVSKAPFGHSRKSSQLVPEPVPATQPPPPAPPTASDFPPPPTPRIRGDVPPPPPPVVAQIATAGKSWASLFSNKSAAVPSTVIAPVMQQVITNEEAPVPPVHIQSATKPVAKVGPFDASPLQPVIPAPIVPDKSPTVTVSPVQVIPTVSYSEKTSFNAQSNINVTPPAPKINTSSPIEVKENVIPKDLPSTLAQPSPFADDPNSYRMGEFLTKYQLDNRTVSLQPRGLSNRSNYCYINAILQALIACPPFYNMLKALPYQTRRGKSSTPIIDAMVELCYQFTPLTAQTRTSRPARSAEVSPTQLPLQTGAPLEPGAGQRVLRAVRPGSAEGRQEDAEEFLSCLLNGLNDEMLELMKLVEPEDNKEAAGAMSNGIVQEEAEDDDDVEWKVMGPKNKGSVERRCPTARTPLADIFRGRTRSRLHRAAADAAHADVTDAVQPFFTLQLDIERASSVKDALELLAGRDQLEGVTLPASALHPAQRVVDAWQQLSIDQLPVVLVLHLKCFQLDADGHTAKIVKNIEFPVDLKIDPKIMSPKMKSQAKQRLYKLFAVVYHEGVEAVKGHYLTDTYHVGCGGWIRYDDSSVTPVNEAQVLKPKPPRMPYLLMYRRQDTVGPAHRPQSKLE